ncbi:MAG: hypothetical protein L3J01_02555 [Thiomicrorhabdus sp.]|nr:hypothetical protein [Thiomicrorhabdus sp.]
MRRLLITYTVILTLGISSMLSGIHHLANVAGFIGAIALLLVFFKDRDEEETEADIKKRRYWYVVCGSGIFFSLIFGSFWNDHMGNMI